VLAADTVVAIGSEVFGKPADAADAAAMLRRLRGRWHEVITGVAVVGAGREATTAVVSRVLMEDVDDRWIEDYVRSGEPLDKAGAYAIQGRGGRLVAGLVGSYTNVVGLPLRETGDLLASFGVTVRPVASP
jgi:septum formation protein